MVLAVMSTEKIVVFAMATMVPWHPTSPVEDDLHIHGAGDPSKGSLLGFTINQQDFSQGLMYGKYFFQTVGKMD